MGTGGVLTGSPTLAGNFTAMVTVTDSLGAKAFASVGINVLGLRTASLPDGTAGQFYSASIAAIGGAGSYAFTATGVPAGLSLSGAGLLSGTVKTNGAYTLAVTVSSSGVSVSGSVGVTFAVPKPLAISSAVLPDATVNVLYAKSFAATGGLPPYTWSVISGTLPQGLSMNAAGSVSGTATTPGPGSFGIQVADSAGATASASASITVDPAPLSITTQALPSGMVNIDYPQQVLGATGGVSPYTWSLSGGGLAAGVTLSSSGVVSGVPTAVGSFTPGITVTDSAGSKATINPGLIIRPASADLVVTAGSLRVLADDSGLDNAFFTTGRCAIDRLYAGSELFGLRKFVGPVAQRDERDFNAGHDTGFDHAGGIEFDTGQLPSDRYGYLHVECVRGPYANGIGGPERGCGSSETAGGHDAALVCDDDFKHGFDRPIDQSAERGRGKYRVRIDDMRRHVVHGGRSAFAYGWSFRGGAGDGEPRAADARVLSNTGGYRDVGGKASVPVTLFIAPNSTMTLAPAGNQFNMPAGSAPGNPNGTFLVSVNNATPVNWTASVATVSPFFVPSWLVLNTKSGTSTNAQPGSIAFSIDPVAAAALAPGAYYGLIQVVSGDIANSPLDFEVVLNVVRRRLRSYPIRSRADCSSSRQWVECCRLRQSTFIRVRSRR